MARYSKVASDGTVFAVYDGPNGNYISTDDDGFHHQPSDGGCGWWTSQQSRRYLREAVELYEEDLAHQASLHREDELLLAWLAEQEGF